MTNGGYSAKAPIPVNKVLVAGITPGFADKCRNGDYRAAFRKPRRYQCCGIYPQPGRDAATSTLLTGSALWAE